VNGRLSFDKSMKEVKNLRAFRKVFAGWVMQGVPKRGGIALVCIFLEMFLESGREGWSRRGDWGQKAGSKASRMNLRTPGFLGF